MGRSTPQAVLSTCSSLIVVVGDGDSRVVQFSHFLVKEFLTSDRLAHSSGEVSRYHILLKPLKPAHMILAQVCLGVLPGLDEHVTERNAEDTPLPNTQPSTGWIMRSSRTCHHRFGIRWNISSTRTNHIGQLDSVYTTSTKMTGSVLLPPPVNPYAAQLPVYYAALCRFYDLTEHLIVKNPGC